MLTAQAQKYSNDNKSQLQIKGHQHKDIDFLH